MEPICNAMGGQLGAVWSSPCSYRLFGCYVPQIKEKEWGWTQAEPLEALARFLIRDKELRWKHVTDLGPVMAHLDCVLRALVFDGVARSNHNLSTHLVWFSSEFRDTNNSQASQNRQVGSNRYLNVTSSGNFTWVCSLPMVLRKGRYFLSSS